MKIGLGVAVAALVAGGVFWAAGGRSEESAEPAPVAEKVPGNDAAPAPPAKSYPMTLPDESAGDWVVDRFAGSSSAGPEFFQGPARQVGGLGRPYSVAPAPDGTVYIAVGAGVVEVSPDGTLRLVIGGGGSQVEGPPDQVVGGGLAWNPKEKMLYLSGSNCIRRLVVKPDGSRVVEVVAGTPRKAGLEDGPAKTATFTTVGNLCINSRGAIYFLDGRTYGECIRKLEDGQVTTITKSGRGGSRVDGPLAQAKFNLIGLGGNISLGEEDDVLYMADHWNYAARRIDVKNGQVTTVAGMPKPTWRKEGYPAGSIEKRFNSNADGPAMTWGSFNSGCGYCCFDPVHKALWVGGPDESRFRWLKDFWGQEGMVKTVIGAKGGDKWNKDGLGTPAEGVKLVWNSVCAVDAQGRAYLAASSDPNGVWRAYNAKEVKP